VLWHCWLGGRKGIRPVKNGGGWWRWARVSLDGVAPSQMVIMSASVNLPLHHKVQKFSSGTSSPGWSRKKGRKIVVVWCLCRREGTRIPLIITTCVREVEDRGDWLMIILLVLLRWIAVIKGSTPFPQESLVMHEESMMRPVGDSSWFWSVLRFSFSALALLVGDRKRTWPLKTWAHLPEQREEEIQGQTG